MSHTITSWGSESLSEAELGSALCAAGTSRITGDPTIRRECHRAKVGTRGARGPPTQNEPLTPASAHGRCGPLAGVSVRREIQHWLHS